MNEQRNSQQGVRFLVIAAALVIIIGGINQAQSVLVSVLVSVQVLARREHQPRAEQDQQAGCGPNPSPSERPRYSPRRQ